MVVAKRRSGKSLLAAVSAVAITLGACTSNASRGATNKTSSGSSTTTQASPQTTGPFTTTAPPTAPPTTTAAAGLGSGALALYVEPQATMAPVYDLMSSAKRSIDMTMYELEDAAAEQVLISDAQRGVAVRVLLDEDYEGRSANQEAYEKLDDAGVAVRWSNDSEIFHQKTITVDGAASAIMTANLTSQYYSTTRDMIVIDHQPQDISAIEQVFSEDFAGGAPSPGPAGQDLVWSPRSEEALGSLITSATRSVICENEEMDSSSIESALEADAKRGLDVTVIMTADTSYDAAFSALRAAGVHVVLYPDTSSGLYIHAKAIDVDATRTFVGSQNFSDGSLNYNRELGIITSAATVVGPLNAVLTGDATGRAAP